MHKELLATLSKTLEPVPLLAKADLATKLAFWLGNVPILKEYGATFAIDALKGKNEALPEEKALNEGNYEKAKKLFASHRKKELEDEMNPLFVPYGCFLRHEKGEAAALRHFSDNISMTGSIPTTSLLAHYLMEKSEAKMTPFPWQQMELLRQSALYAHCSNEPKKSATFMKKLCQLQNQIS